MTGTFSDSHNPEGAHQQILSIAPILPGQTDPSQFHIPPHKQKEEHEAPSDETEAKPATTQSQPQPPMKDEEEAPVERKDSRTAEFNEYVNATDKPKP